MTDHTSPATAVDLETLNGPAYAKDSDLRFMAANEAFLSLFGLERDVVQGRTAGEVLGIDAVSAERDVLIFGTRQMATFRHDAHEYCFRLHREGSLSDNPLIVGVMQSKTRLSDEAPVSIPPAPEPALQYSEPQMDDLSIVAHHMNTGTLLLDADLRIVAANDILYRVWDVDPTSFSVGDSFVDFMEAGRSNRAELTDDNEWCAYVEGIENGIRSRAIPTCELPLAGQRRLRGSGVSLSDGRSLLTFDDISLHGHSVESIAALKQTVEVSDRLLRNILDNTPAAMVVYDAENNFVLDNKARRVIAPHINEVMRPGKTLEDFVRCLHRLGTLRETENKDLDAIHDTDPETWMARRLREYNAPARTVERRTLSGRWLKVMDRRLEDGFLIRMWTDVTDIKKREAQLDKVNVVVQTSLKTLRAAIEAIPDGMAVWDRQERLIICNKRFAAQFPDVDMQPGQLVKETLHLFALTGAVPDATGREEAWAQEKLETWRQALDKEYLFETHDGRWIKAIDRKTPDGFRVGMRTDITELKRREIDLEKAKVTAETAERSKSEFLANMSHEIRTPMNGILGMAEILTKTELDDRQQSFADVIMTSGNALLTIINDILDFSKIDAGQLSLNPAPFQLSRAIDDVATLLSTRSVEKDLEVIVRIAPGVPDYLIGDAGRLRQIVTNLMGNAVKFTEEGHVLVDIDGKPGPKTEEGHETLSLHCRIVDTGIGIPEDRINDVFSKFSQVDGSSTRQHEGTGLGLAIAMRLVEFMGGEIGCESTVGKGSTFWFTVPLPIDRSGIRPKAPPTDLTGTQVLVIDDNAINRSILLEQLAAWGFEGVAAASGEKGLSILHTRQAEQKPIEAVILDYHMPQMNGTQVAQAIRGDAALASTPIVMLTSIDLDVASPDFQALEVNGYLVKPARSAVLLKTIVTAIRAPSQQEVDDEIRVAEKPMVEIGTHVLVADDNRVNQFVVREVLDALGMTCVTASDGIEAVEAYSEKRPCLVLMDVTMPRMNGHDATREIRRIEGESGVRVPIIGATAHASDKDRKACLDSGMDDYISKPISPKDLQEKIRRWLTEEADALSA